MVAIPLKELKDAMKDETTPNNSNKREKKAKKKSSRKSTDSTTDSSEKKRKRKSMELPKVDPETGHAFNKQQLRKMKKRVERGLDPIPTPQEKDELAKQEAQLKREEEEELAGIIKKDDEQEEENSDDDDDDEEEDKEEEEPTKKKKIKKSNKPVPSDYVCFACKNECQPAHWIYDCPKKVSTGKKKSSSRSSNSSNSMRKVFVSGLPFDFRRKDLLELFASNKLNGGKVSFCRLLHFPDSGRCKGEAVITFDSKEAANKALKMNGQTIDQEDSSKKSLTLKVARHVSSSDYRSNNKQ
eukprot:CAMPEP_0194041128 /NCGR_PEP_ID=MMETSP0009_2-20130614/13026_1 /TAXON_ID=210454 /ORGANISM="Grammatophora oceanica, Strain CCMP 410" /LENGTH=297 /DNA_ID=CAMNT_0038684495 /DNA_START=32 /DNA_END=925 /DNA_ORIENTATION=+